MPTTDRYKDEGNFSGYKLKISIYIQVSSSAHCIEKFL